MPTTCILYSAYSLVALFFISWLALGLASVENKNFFLATLSGAVVILALFAVDFFVSFWGVQKTLKMLQEDYYLVISGAFVSCFIFVVAIKKDIRIKDWNPLGGMVAGVLGMIFQALLLIAVLALGSVFEWVEQNVQHIFVFITSMAIVALFIFYKFSPTKEQKVSAAP